MSILMETYNQSRFGRFKTVPSSQPTDVIGEIFNNDCCKQFETELLQSKELQLSSFEKVA